MTNIGKYLISREAQPNNSGNVICGAGVVFKIVEQKQHGFICYKTDKAGRSMPIKGYFYIDFYNVCSVTDTKEEAQYLFNRHGMPLIKKNIDIINRIIED